VGRGADPRGISLEIRGIDSIRFEKNRLIDKMRGHG